MSAESSSFDQLKKNMGVQTSEKKGVPSHLMLTDHFRITMIVVLISLSSLALFGYLGYRLDQHFDAGYLFLSFLLILSFPLAQYAIYKWIVSRYLQSIKKKYSSNS